MSAFTSKAEEIRYMHSHYPELSYKDIAGLIGTTPKYVREVLTKPLVKPKG